MSHPLDNIPLLPHVFYMDFDVIIVGAGLTGITLALALDQSGIRTAIIDQNTPVVKPNDSFNGRSYAIAAASQKMLNVLGQSRALKTASKLPVTGRLKRLTRLFLLVTQTKP